MEYNLNCKIRESSLPSRSSIIIESAMDRFEKRINENREKEERTAEVIPYEGITIQSGEKVQHIVGLTGTTKQLDFQNRDNSKGSAELIIANKELAFQLREKADRAAELIIANKELAFQRREKADRAAELIIANKKLSFQIKEKADRSVELIIANKKLAFQIREKTDRTAELIIANKKITYQNGEKADLEIKLIIANKDLDLQNIQNAEQASELIIANKEIVFQRGEKAERAAELIIANKELAFQSEEKADRAAESIIANKEISLQSKRNAEQASALTIANKAQGEYFINISHELKTPLNIICSTVQLFDMYCNSGSLYKRKNSIIKYMDSIKQNSYRLSKLITNIIDSSKIDAGFFELHLSNNNIVEVIEKIVMAITNFTDSKSINIIFDTNIEEKVIACDAENIERIVLNLISNAIKFSDEGDEILVEVKDKSEFVEISVKDNGIGIEKKDLNMIFDRFKQVDKSLSRNTEGTGIGLSLVKSIAELHSGSVHVESEFGKGSRFTVKLPSIKVAHDDILCNRQMMNKNKTIQIELSDIYL